MTPATPEDIPWIEAHLRAHLATSIFSLLNLGTHGLGGEAPRAMHYWIDRERNHLLGVTTEGMLMPQAPGSRFESARKVLEGRTVMGATGDTTQTRAVLEALDLHTAPTKLDENETQFTLSLESLRIPGGDGALATPTEADLPTVRAWRRAYALETLGEDEPGATALADREAPGMIASGNYRLLKIDGQPVAFTGFNARLLDIVQIGGVYTPPELRGRGLARRAVALHLSEARDDGIPEATLFSHNPSAIRSYQAIGFRPTGTYTLTLFRDPQVIA